jgi:thymidylate synthase
VETRELLQVIYSRNCSDAWKKSIEAVCSKGTRTGEIIELLNLINHIRGPSTYNEVCENVYRDLIPARAIKRATTMLLKEGSYRGKVTYWERLTNWHGSVNQLHMVADRISKKPKSKHLSCSVIDPATDWTYHGFMPSQPCLLAIDFRFRRGTLGLTSFFRSQDILNIGYADYKALGAYLNVVARELQSHKKSVAGSVKIGSLVCHTTSAFIYARDRNKATGVLKALLVS